MQRQTASKPREPVDAPGPESSAVAEARLEIPWWRDRHERILSRVRQGGVDLVFAGDSHVQTLEGGPGGPAKSIWNRLYAPRRGLNLGFSGDTTPNLLWRLANGEIDGLQPRLVIVLIGANDVVRPRWPAERTLTAMDAVVAAIRARAPGSKILLVAVPAGERPPRVEDKVSRINQELARRWNGSDTVAVVDLGPAFAPDGILDRSLFVEPALAIPKPATHMNAAGQERMARALEPAVAACFDALSPTR